MDLKAPRPKWRLAWSVQNRIRKLEGQERAVALPVRTRATRRNRQQSRQRQRGAPLGSRGQGDWSGVCVWTHVFRLQEKSQSQSRKKLLRTLANHLF